MEPGAFFQRMRAVFELPGDDRHRLLIQLHRRLLDVYLDTLLTITEAQAARPVNLGGDTRTVKQIVAHIGDWQRYETLAAGDILGGLRKPRGVVGLADYYDLQGRQVEFKGVDELNAYQAEQHQNWDWRRVQSFAINRAETLYTLFATPGLLTASRLTATDTHIRRFGDQNTVYTQQGWVLWAMELEHMSVQHREELGLP